MFYKKLISDPSNEAKEVDLGQITSFFVTLRYINSAIKKGIPSFQTQAQSTDIAGLHGTSVESLIKIYHEGIIKPYTVKTAYDIESHKDRVYLVPFSESFKSHLLSSKLEDISIESVISSSVKYARMSAFFSYFQEKMPGVITSWNYIHLVMNPKSEEALIALYQMSQRCESIVYAPDLFFQTLEKATKRKGAVLSVDSKTINKFIYHDGDKTPGKEVFIQTEKGISIENVVGIEFMVDSERDEFMKAYLLK